MKSIRIAIILLIACISMFACLSPVFGGLIGNCVSISGLNGRFPDVAYNNTNGNYLVVWTQYRTLPNVNCIMGRFVSSDGALIGNTFQISNNSYYALMPNIAYNAASNEYLVAWIDGRYINGKNDIIFGQRVSANGSLIGTDLQIGNNSASLCNVGSSSSSNCYLVIYHAGDVEVYGRMVNIVSGNAQMGSVFNISNDTDYSGYSNIAYNPMSNEFLVTWDDETPAEVRNIYARRVKAPTGELLGSVINATNSFAKDRSCVAADSVNNRWFIRSNDYSAAAQTGYDQSAVVLNADGSRYSGPIPISATSIMEGDTLRCGGISFAPAPQRYFSTFAAAGKMTGVESNADGYPVSGLINLSSGSTEIEAFSNTNAADVDRNRFLTVWDSFDGTNMWISGRIYSVPISPVINFTASAQNGAVQLSWTNPGNLQFTRTMIRYKTTGYPTSPEDGTLVIDKAGLPGSADTYTHTGLTNGTTYYYSAFAHDAGLNYATLLRALATPPNITRLTINNSNFNYTTNSWIISSWKSCPSCTGYADGTITWDMSAGKTIGSGGMRCHGSGDTDNNDRCNREGAEIQKVISTANKENIFITYDLRVNSLGNDYTGAGIGTCAVDHNLIDEQLNVYYSTNGGTSWNEVESIKRADLVGSHQGYEARQFDLSGIPACNNNTQFALRFRWQLNSASDTGDLDNIIVKGTNIPPAPPAPIVTDDGAYTGSLSKLHCRWTPGGSGSNEYKYCIGTSSGATNIVDWTNVGTATEVLREDLTLSENQTYYFSVQAGNGYGAWSPSGYSDGITAPIGVGIQDAKAFDKNGQVRAIRGKVVSVAFPGYFYIQEPDSYFGIKAVSSTVVLAGQKLDIAGVIDGADSERYINCTDNPLSVATPGLFNIDAVAMNNAAIGGPLFNSITPGVVGGRGVNNLGSLIRFWGKVTQRDTVNNQYFYIDDGSGLRDGTKTAEVDNVGIRIKSDPTAYPANSFVVITGISSCFTDSSNNLRPQVLPKP